MNEEKEAPVHYQISVTSRQAGGFFLALLLALGLAFFFGMKTGAAARKKEPETRLADATETVPADDAAEPRRRLGFDKARGKSPEPTPSPEEPTKVPTETPKEVTKEPTPEPTREPTVMVAEAKSKEATKEPQLVKDAAAAAKTAAPEPTTSSPPQRTALAPKPTKTPAKPAPKATPAPEPTAEARVTHKDGPFYVSVLAIKDARKVDEVAKRLKAAGYKADVLPVSGRAGMFRVRVGPYAEKSRAEAAARKIRESEKALRVKPVVTN